MRKIITIILSVLIILALIGGVVALIVSSNPENFEEKVYEFTTTNDLKNINVSTSSSTVEIKKGNETGIKVEVEESEKTRYAVTYVNGTLKIVEKTTWFTFFNFRQKKVVITVPDQVYNVDINTISAKVILEELSNYQELSVDTSSGDIFISNATITGEMELKSSSGSIHLNEITTNESIDAATSSGSIVYDSCKLMGRIDTSSSSGSIKLKNCEAKAMKLSTSSGSIEINLTNTDVDNIKAISSSGSIRIFLSENISGFTINAKTSSGHYESNFANNNPNYYGDGKIIIDAQTSSGNITVNK